MYIVADIGGTKTRIAGSRDLASFYEPVIIPTEREYEKAIITIEEIAKKIAGEEKIEAMAVGLRGRLSRDKRSLFSDAILSDWSGHSVASDLEGKLGTKVYMENDTAMVGLGESTYGAGKGAPIVAYITVSTGVGGARIVDGKIDRAAIGFEIGHQYISVDERLVTRHASFEGLSEGVRKILETCQELEKLVSGSAVERLYGTPAVAIPEDSPLWSDLADLLTFGIYNTILHWSPDKVVLGGSMFNRIGIHVDRVNDDMQKLLTGFLPEIPVLAHSELGDLGGLWGGLARIKQG